jgi:hypothetical protein
MPTAGQPADQSRYVHFTATHLACRANLEDLHESLRRRLHELRLLPHWQRLTILRRANLIQRVDRINSSIMPLDKLSRGLERPLMYESDLNKERRRWNISRRTSWVL